MHRRRGRLPNASGNIAAVVHWGGLIVAYGLGCAYRLAWTTVSDAILLVVMTGAALGAAHPFG